MPYESLFLMTPGKSRAVFLSPIDPAEFSGIDVKELKSIAEKKMSDKLIEYKASWINNKYFNQ
jgi:hypothetical protein